MDAVAELNDADPDLDLRVRSGVNTGEAVVAFTVPGERGEAHLTVR